MNTNRMLIAGLTLCCIAVLILWLVFWKTPVAVITVTITPEREQGHLVFEQHARIPRDRFGKTIAETQVPLDRWEGELVRIDIRGKVAATKTTPIRRGWMACSALLSDANTGAQITFPGWLNDGPPELHLGALGCRIQRVQGHDPELTYSEDEHLWRVLRVPQGATLNLAFVPVANEIASSPPDHTRGSATGVSTFEADSISNSSPNIFIYLIDCLRADHVCTYGYSRGTTPNIDEFAASATIYEQAQTAATWTRPSVASLLTGLSPFVHGAMHRTTDKLQEWPIMLPEVLQAAGYQTAGIVTNTAVNAESGFNQGYDFFRYHYKYPTDWINDQTEEFLRSTAPDRPVFMYLHIMEVHSPYTPKPESREMFDRGFDGKCDGTMKSLGAIGRIRPKVSSDDVQHLVDLYDAEVFDADRGFGHFLEILDAAGRFDNSLIILLADHGEAFNEHRTLEHGNTLNVEEMHVPLIARYPHGQFAGRRISQRVITRDVYPTVLNVAGIEWDISYPLEGLDLRPGSPEGATDAVRPVFVEVSKHANNHLDLIAVIDEEGFKRTIDTSMPRGIRATKESIGLWNTGIDECEQTNIEDTESVRADYCEQLIVDWLIEQRDLYHRLTPSKISRIEMSEEMERELRGLGYVD